MKKTRKALRLSVVIAVIAVGMADVTAQQNIEGHKEQPDDPYILVLRRDARTAAPAVVQMNGFSSVQVNVDSGGNNIIGDAANEPSIAVDPINPSRMAIGWRQFDTITSNFRQAGYGYTNDGGQTWTFPGVIEPGIFRSDPVLDSDSNGNFVYDSLGTPGGDFCTDTFISADGGQTWPASAFSFGGDKQWITVDKSGGMGDGHIYRTWNRSFSCAGGIGRDFNLSSDGGANYSVPIALPISIRWGVPAVGPQGEVYVVGAASTLGGFALAKSTTLQDTKIAQAFDFFTDLDLGGSPSASAGPNPAGLLSQVWVAADPVDPMIVYVLASVNPPGPDPVDVHFVRSEDGGVTFGAPIRINTDVGTNAWQWFGTMSVAPNGRIDVIWNDSREDPGGFDSQVYYSWSVDGGDTWSENMAVTPAFDPHLGWPNQNKIGDYYHMVSDDTGANLAYSATFNGEQDVYFLRLSPLIDFEDGFEDDASAP